MYLILFLVLCVGYAHSQTLIIQVSGLRSNSGSIQVQFFDSQKNFDKEKPLFTRINQKTNVSDGEFTITYHDIKPGLYGIAILDDENNNRKMDYGFFLPKEGFGFSDYYHKGMTQPDFKKFSFTMGSGTKKVSIKVRYM